MNLLKDKVALITGVGQESSIGFATAKLFAAEGARLALLDIDADAVEQAYLNLGQPHRAFAADVREKEQCVATVERVIDEFGRIDVLVSSAGVVSGTRILDIDEIEYSLMLDVNLKGNFLMAQAVVPHMREQGEGNIVCISSIAGQSGGGVFGSAHYAAAKSGIFGLAKALARELAAEGIRVNAIAPGPIDNDFTRGKMTPEIKAELAKKIPLGRLGRPQEVAKACLFLASGLSSYITGVVLDVNGGLLIH